MNVKDLRVGNIVSFGVDKNDNQRYCKVEEVSGITNTALVSKGQQIFVARISDLEPVFLTDELMSQMGAFKVNYLNHPSYNLRGFTIHFTNNMWLEYVSRVEIQGLHHLQNMFYFKMTEELEIIC